MTRTIEGLDPGWGAVPPGPTATAAHYRSFGWPVRQDRAGDAVLLLTGDVVDAILLDAGLCAAVLDHLSVRMLAGAVLSYRVAPGSMIFLTTPATPVRRSTLADLERAHVTLPQPGSALALPAGGRARAASRWVRAPRPGAELAPWQAVVSSVRAVLSTGTSAA